jgi:hypothetical protein
VALIFRRKKIWAEVKAEIHQWRDEALQDQSFPKWLEQKCEHTDAEFRRLKTANGVFQLRKQCLDCGELVGGAFRRDAVHGFDRLLLVDEVARHRAQNQWRDKSEQRQQIAERYREEEQKAFWEYYNAHLNSPEWREKCRLKRERASNVCEGCGVNKVNHIHHLTYDNLGDELLFELVALCVECHQKIHPHREIA